MKKLFTWMSGFFSSESNNSSKRLVGIVGAGFLYWTLYTNSKSETHVAPSESLVWATTSLIMVSLGLTTIESVTGLIKGFRQNKTEE